MAQHLSNVSKYGPPSHGGPARTTNTHNMVSVVGLGRRRRAIERTKKSSGPVKGRIYGRWTTKIFSRAENPRTAENQVPPQHLYPKGNFGAGGTVLTLLPICRLSQNRDVASTTADSVQMIP